MKGVGLDLVDISRFEKMTEERKLRFAKRFLSQTEFTSFRGSDNSSKFLARAFAIKEAGLKSLGKGLFDSFVKPSDLSSSSLETGQPTLEIQGSDHKFMLSVSYEKGIVAAVVFSF